MSRSDLIEQVPELRRELREIETRIAQLSHEANALRDILQAIDRLAGRSSQLTIAAPSAEAVATAPAPTVVSELPGPRGKDAVRALLADGRIWKQPAIIAEIKRRGWIKAGASRPDQAIRQAVRRLVDANEVERVGDGYRLASPLLPFGEGDARAVSHDDRSD